jgi:hypothetical protein
MASRLCLLLTGSFVLLSACSTAPSDVALVQCTAPAQQAHTVDAAISLRLVHEDSRRNSISVGGETYEFDEWRAARFEDFTRACEALAEQARPAAPNPLVTQSVAALISLVTLMVGVVTTWLTTSRRDEINRRRQHAGELHRASRAFVVAVRDYCDARLRRTENDGPPPVSEVRHTRDDLSAQLTRTEALRPRWNAPAVLRASLTGSVLGNEIETRWDFERNREERRPRADEVNNAVNDLDRGVDVLVRALERPRRDVRKLCENFPVGGLK